ncbi:MAG: transglutaminase-like domain-containing protein, partial [Sandaracinaceae bacterium]|nr:transglutaminase-like domain-containing protein [Sandaracinaceae bacterium]
VWFRDAPNPNPQRFLRAYRAWSRAQSVGYRDLFGRRAGNPAWAETIRDLYLQPHADPRFEAFARETIATLPPARREDPFAQAVAIKLRLDELLVYSTRERHATDDPTVDFFFGNRIGYCVHFAHTAVYLWRSIGIPARIGVGYASAEANRRGGSALAIRSGDAHAWPELYLEGVGWVVLDIAAHENLDPPRPAQDDDLQRLLGEMAREQPPDPEDEVRPRAARRDQPFPWLALLISFATILAALLLSLYAVKLWRRLAPSFSADRALPRIGYRALLDVLCEAGLYREHGETREEFARRIAGLTPSFARATELHLQAKLSAEGGGTDRVEWRRLLRTVPREVSGSTPWWRRALGVLHPLAYLDSR